MSDTEKPVLEEYETMCQTLHKDQDIVRIKAAIGDQYFTDTESKYRWNFNTPAYLKSPTTLTGLNASSNAMVAKDAVDKVKEDIRGKLDKLKGEYASLTSGINKSTTPFKDFAKALGIYYYIKLLVIVFVALQTKLLTLFQDSYGSACKRGNSTTAEKQQLEAKLTEKESALAAKEQELVEKEFILKQLEEDLRKEREDRAREKKELEEKLAEETALLQKAMANAQGSAGAILQEKQAELDKLSDEKEVLDTGLKNYNTATNDLNNKLDILGGELLSILEGVLQVSNTDKDKVRTAVADKYNRRNVGVAGDKYQIFLKSMYPKNVLKANASSGILRLPSTDPFNSQKPNLPDDVLRSYVDPLNKMAKGDESYILIKERIAIIKKEIENLRDKNTKLVEFLQDALPVLTKMSLSETNSI